MAVSSDILRGHTETVILRILMGGDSYGYEITKKILEGGAGLIEVKDATIYTAFRRMEAEGLLATYWGEGIGGARRRYYAITEKGKTRYYKLKEEWLAVQRVLSRLILGKTEENTEC